MNGVFYERDDAGVQFVKHFENVLGSSSDVVPLINPESLFHKKVSKEEGCAMLRPVTKEEIKDALFDIDDDKALGPDGFSSKFFKAYWEIIGNEVCTVVKDFFDNGQMLNEINATVIALVPEIQTPQTVSDYRPIACCNVLYKIISKVLASRIKGCLDEIVSENQSDFIPNRQISDNILLSQELMRNYHRKKGNAKCALKVDIQKAYDSVNWRFLEACLLHFDFPKKMIRWIMKCITSTSIMLNINGDMQGYFKGKKGLRQGDPISPYLFTLVMEVLNLIVKRRIRGDDRFKYHWKCEGLSLVQLCFADDLLLFCNGDLDSVKVLKESLDEFGSVSGLIPNVRKSLVIFDNVQNEVKSSIIQLLGFQIGAFPITYLGVPLLSKRLYIEDCKVLVDKVKKKVQD